MSSKTPSGRRRAGRNAFEPYVDPMDVQPYQVGTWEFKAYLLDWLEGWSEAKRAYEKEQKELEEAKPDCNCPKYAFECSECVNEKCEWKEEWSE